MQYQQSICKIESKVTTAIATTLLGKSYPPSDDIFSDAANSFIKPIKTFLVNNGSTLLVNVYTYFAYTNITHRALNLTMPYSLHQELW